jgi:hypothetical protein
MAMRRRSVLPAEVMHLAKLRWQAKSRETRRANSLMKAADWRPQRLEPQD